ncbi:SLBB domain-containing protein [Marinoscillum pacificum]|uniref:SLBB domain-containing protein n=1 Tax=Marinoscillum pacificum TaxID=392723 RepID=UPI00215731CA|nr:SLBB domain-containing protein [Marinoscillum pacificum]
MHKNLVVVLFAIILFGYSDFVSAQNANSIQNLENVNVDELSDDQIQRIIDQAESGGYTEQQLEFMARSRGMSSAQISKLRQRINEVRNGSSSKSSNISSVDRSRVSPNQEEVDANRSSGFDPFQTIFPEDTLVDPSELKIFGLDFFNNPEISFDPSLNIATPADYQIGPGDQIVIDVWGASEQNYQLQVSPEGSIIIPNLGPIYLNGLSVEKAETRIKSRLKNIYSTLGQNTFAQVSLGQIRTVSVNVLGEVAQPGTYQVSSFTTAFNALYNAGGPTENGSFRSIGIYRSGKEVAVLDAYNFLISGTGQNIMLQDQDVVMVKPYENRVAVRGEVKRPAYYEVIKGESLNDVVSFAGGFTGWAYKKSISIRRNLDNRKTVVTVLANRFPETGLIDGDDLEVGKIQNQFVNRVRVEGAVNHPGEFELSDGMTLKDLINYVDGLRADAFLQRGIIIRQNDDLTLSNISFSPREIVSGESDLMLKSEDLIKIQSIFDLREEYMVSIQGEVLTPGDYPFADGMTVENLIYLANGFKETAAKSFVEVARRVTDEDGDGSATATIYNFPIDKNLSIKDGDKDFQLKPFDLVVIRKSPFYEKQNIVEVEGEAQYPGKYALASKNERISDVLTRAGGTTKYAYIKGATLIRRTEYFVNKGKGESDSNESTDAAAKIRQEDLKSLLERDTLVDQRDQVFKTQESIGIKLDEILKAPGSKYDLILKEGDVLSIPRQLQTVRIRGEVLYPSTVRFDNNRTFRQYISQSGGFSDDAKKGKSYVVYPNGSAERTKSFLWFKNYPRVDPGAEVIIPRKPEKRKLSPQEVIGIASGLGTLALIINNLTR